jgi:DNA/RNA-binding domain of Phe-tRNA-synthetase-like protein
LQRDLPRIRRPNRRIDLTRITDYLEVRYASGTEVYEPFSGESEHPEPREVVFVDGANSSHARRWTNRPSASSAVRHETEAVLIVAEAMHASAHADVERLVATLADELDAVWSASATAAILTSSAPRFEL